MIVYVPNEQEVGRVIGCLGGRFLAERGMAGYRAWLSLQEKAKRDDLTNLHTHSSELRIMRLFLEPLLD